MWTCQIMKGYIKPYTSNHIKPDILIQPDIPLTYMANFTILSQKF